MQAIPVNGRCLAAFKVSSFRMHNRQYTQRVLFGWIVESYSRASGRVTGTPGTTRPWQAAFAYADQVGASPAAWLQILAAKNNFFWAQNSRKIAKAPASAYPADLSTI